tara:strand:- start:330 stop:566 length:237 start_codon:yes stop_codon:yes gene_type:complete
MIEYESVKDVPKTLADFFSISDLEGKSHVEISYSYPSGSLVVHEVGVIGSYRLELLSAEIDGRDALKIRATYRVQGND